WPAVKINRGPLGHRGSLHFAVSKPRRGHRTTGNEPDEEPTETLMGHLAIYPRPICELDKSILIKASPPPWPTVLAVNGSRRCGRQETARWPHADHQLRRVPPAPSRRPLSFSSTSRTNSQRRSQSARTRTDRANDHQL